MRFLTDGDYEFDGATLYVRAEHDDRRYSVQIERGVFEQQFAATATGDFHEYWDLLLQNRSELEAVAAERLRTAAPADDRVITIGNGDFNGKKPQRSASERD